MNLTKVVAVVLCASMVGIGGISKLNAMDDENNVGCADCRVSDECYRKNKDILQDLTKLEKLAEKYKLKSKMQLFHLGIILVKYDNEHVLLLSKYKSSYYLIY